MSIRSNRATVEEKAQAWDRLMQSKGTDAEAIIEAYEHLTDLVKNREAKTVKTLATFDPGARA